MVEIFDPTRIRNWDAMLRSLPGATFFCTQAWAQVLHASYGYTPMYFALVGSGRLEALLPVMEVASVLTGKRGVSLPFTDFCEPLVPHEQTLYALFDAVKREGRARGWKYVDLRMKNGFLRAETPSLNFHGHDVDLGAGQDRLYAQLTDSNRRNIRKAEKCGVEVRLETSLVALHEFYGLNCLTRRRHGLPPQPWRFFEHVHREVLEKGMGVVAMARHEGVPVAGNVYFHYGDKVLYKFGASDMRFQHLRAGNLVMWTAIRHFAGKGFRNLCLGRTEPENFGLRRFKAEWGTTETDIIYYRYDFETGAFVADNDNVSQGKRDMFSRLPLPALKMLGSLLYRHVG